ncbi:MAG: MMPL family transporter [Pseudomonadales bacterium]|nr:MMPL family transporter [Pseudomonadales bacterium]
MTKEPLLERIVGAIFSHRPAILLGFLALTLFMGFNALHLRVDSGFEKLMPLNHDYIRTLTHYQEDFGSGNQIIVALMNKEGSIFTPDFFKAMKAATDEVFYLPGVARSTVTSIFTPNVIYIEVIEDGFYGGNVIPAEFQPTEEWMPIVRSNIIKSGRIGDLVANDFSGALIRAELIERDPTTGKPLDYQQIAADLEEKIRARFETDDIEVRIIGFAKSTGDIAQGARGVVTFFGITLVVTGILLWLYTGSVVLSLLPPLVSLVSVIGLLGSLDLLGYGLDPMSILVPFLVFAIGVSHGVQMVSGWMGEVMYGGDTDAHGRPVVPAPAVPHGVDSFEAAQRTFRRLLVPGALAVITTSVSFATILLIDIQIVRETAIIASIGMAIMLFTKMILLPVLLSYVRIGRIEAYRQRHRATETRRDPLWRFLARATETGPSLAILAVVALMALWGADKGRDMKIGDLHAGIPELREDARYNLDSHVIADKFSIGVDKLSVIVEAPENACVDYAIMKEMDRFAWHVQNLPGVHSVDSLARAMKLIIAANNESSPRWFELSREPLNMASALHDLERGGGDEYMNAPCSAMPVNIFTVDHKAETIDAVIRGIESFESVLPPDKFKLRLASGNVGIIAATNQTVAAAEHPMLAWVYAVTIVLSLLAFRSIAGTLCIVIPLAVVSLLGNAMMAVLDIGLKVNTLPMMALGVGVGVDYAIYIYAAMIGFVQTGDTLTEAFYKAMRLTGKAVIFIGLTLGAGVCTWIFAPLKFQADMGVLLTFLFLTNMLGAILILPALARWLLPAKR